PSVRPIRYVPTEELRLSDDAQEKLTEAIRALNITDERVYLIYSTWTPVIEISLSDLHLNTDIIYEPMETVCVTSPSFSWISCRSLENEWAWLSANNPE